MKSCLFILMLSAVAAGAQPVIDTTYYDMRWKKCPADSFVYYRTSTHVRDLYNVVDHYKNGTPQMIGTYTSLDPEVKNGFFTYYFPSGCKEEEAEYYNNKRRGTFRFYEDYTEALKSSMEYLNDMKNGRSVRYANGRKVVNVYSNDKLVAADIEAKKNPEQASQNYISADTKAYEKILKRKFEFLPDSIRGMSAVVTVTFEVDSDGLIFNPQVGNSANKMLTNLVVSSLHEMPKWSTTSAGSTAGISIAHSFTVIFPKLSVATGTSMVVKNAGANNKIANTANKDSSWLNILSSMQSKSPPADWHAPESDPFFNLDSSWVKKISSINNQNVSFEWFSPDALKGLSIDSSLSGVAKSLQTLSYSFQRQSPSAPGHLQADSLRQFILGKYSGHEKAYKVDDKTTVMVQFEISGKGGPENISLIWGQNKKLNDFVIRMINQYNKFTPLLVNGEAVATIYKLSISFPDIKVTGNSIARSSSDKK